MGAECHCAKINRRVGQLRGGGGLTEIKPLLCNHRDALEYLGKNKRLRPKHVLTPVLDYQGPPTPWHPLTGLLRRPRLNLGRSSAADPVEVVRLMHDWLAFC